MFKYHHLRKYTKILADNTYFDYFSKILNDRCFEHIIKVNKYGGVVELMYHSPYFEKKIIELTTDQILIKYRNTNITELFEINFNGRINELLIDKRKNGIVVKKISYTYEKSGFKNEIVNIKENKYVVLNEEIEKEFTVDEFIDRTIKFFSMSELLEKSKLSNEVEIGYALAGTLNIKEHNNTYIRINDEVYFDIYKNIRGSKIITRIYDLYKGKITKDNIGDIKNIKQGIISEDCFGLYEVSGLRTLEDELSGERIVEKKEREYNIEHYSVLDELTKRDELLDDIYENNISNIRKKYFRK